ncbi:MAG: carbon starvation protein A [Rhodospirillaceae bacterium]|nr:carbon starvation protein A [Rhodospirillaceae bacterium]
MGKTAQWVLWGGIAILGAACMGVLALHEGESINAAWLVVAAVCTSAIGYRFDSAYVANTVLGVDPNRPTPAVLKNDGLDYVPTNKYVLFGHHFAAIAGAGPLVGPTLAAQMGYLPGTIWILVGAVFAGCVQDYVILFFSTRRNGNTLGQMIRDNLGKDAGIVAIVGILSIMIILLAVLSLVIVKALADSPWGVFTVAMSIPIAVLMGLYMRYIRPGKVLEVSIGGFVLLMAALYGGAYVAEHPEWGEFFTLSGTAITWWLVVYAFVSSVLPVWLMLAPRDYLSTFLKIGTIGLLAVGILVVTPDLQMPAMTKFVDGTGPVFAGTLFPFLFITIACGAISGFHALVSSGTTPKMMENEIQGRPVGYGAMICESFVAIMALIAACALEPGVYFAMNSPAAVIGTSVDSAATTISSWGFVITPEMLSQMATDVGETSILSRTGGAPTLAVGMAHILSQFLGGTATMAFWYHFAILFEAMFILTTLSAGTRVARFMIQDLLGMVSKTMGDTSSTVGNLTATGLACAAWGYFTYQGVIDPFGGINSLWALFGVANQMLAAIALILATVLIVQLGQMKRIWVTAVPLAWLLICTMAAGWDKLFHADPKIGFLSHAKMIEEGLASGTVMAPAKSIEEMQRIVFNDYLDAGICAFFMLIVVALFFFGIRAIRGGQGVTVDATPSAARTQAAE